MPVPRRFPRRIATISVHTSPLEQPGTGDAGGLNVYVVEVSKRLAAHGVEVEIFTRAVSRNVLTVSRSTDTESSLSGRRITSMIRG